VWQGCADPVGGEYSYCGLFSIIGLAILSSAFNRAFVRAAFLSCCESDVSWAVTCRDLVRLAPVVFHPVPPQDIAAGATTPVNPEKSGRSGLSPPAALLLVSTHPSFLACLADEVSCQVAHATNPTLNIFHSKSVNKGPTTSIKR
jgi:hypothetical protein